MKKVIETIIILLSIALFTSCASRNFSGTYSFDYYDYGSVAYQPKVVVTGDGRCILLYNDGSSTFIGNVDAISSHAFSLMEGHSFYGLTVKLYSSSDNEQIGFTYPEYDWKYYDLVFDVKENRLYLSYEEYMNRDITSATYTKLYH